MRSRSDWSFPAVSLLGLSVGLAAGVAAGLLAAPMRGVEMRRSLRSRVSRHERDMLPASATPPAGAFSATLGEIAQMHSSNDIRTYEARS